MKLKGPGVLQQIASYQFKRNEMIANLNVGDWVAFKSTDDPDQPFWIGVYLSRNEWDNDCKWKNATGRETVKDSVLVLKDGYAINVQWYTQNVIGVLEYVVEGGESAMPIIQSSADLILTGFTMHQVYGTSIRVPRQRSVRSNRMADFEYDTGARRTLQTTEGEWYRSEYGNRWRLDDQLRDKLLELAADMP